MGVFRTKFVTENVGKFGENVEKKLENDEDYYGEFGQQYLSNSDISTLLKNPLAK